MYANLSTIKKHPLSIKPFFREKLCVLSAYVLNKNNALFQCVERLKTQL